MRLKKTAEKLSAITLFVVILTSFTSCEPEIETDYQAYMAASPERVILVVNGNSESISAYDPADGSVYNDIQTVGYSGTNQAIPSDILINEDNLYVSLSGQNSIETYDKISLDYVDGGRHYFDVGYNPMQLIPVPGTSWVFVPGFATDEVQIVNLAEPEQDYSFLKVFDEVSMPDGSNSETKTAVTETNAVGDNKDRSSTGGIVFLNGESSYLYISNVRYDASILLKDPWYEDEADLAEYPEDSGKNVKAGGYFREATLSIFGFNADALTDGASDDQIDLNLIKEINLEELYYDGIGSGEYFPGNGLNPQSVFILDGMLNIVCTGTNGGSTSSYSDSEYLPEGFFEEDEKPGTNPDDGVIIIADISDPEDPVYVKHLDIGGSPSGFRNAIDSDRKIVYLAGVGGIQSYRYGADKNNYSVLHSYSDMLLTSDDPDSDYYAGLCYDEVYDALYISFYSGDSLKRIDVTGSEESPSYSELESFSVGDGPGALCILENE